MKKIMVIVVAVMLFLGSTGLAQAFCEKERGEVPYTNGRVRYVIIDKTCDGHAEEMLRATLVMKKWHLSSIHCWNNYSQTWDLIWEVGDGTPIHCPN